jgi:hypothetical protein
MRSAIVYLAFLCTLFNIGLSQYPAQFTVRVELENQPGMRGRVGGLMKYDRIQKRMLIEYDKPKNYGSSYENIKQMYFYDNKTRSTYCPWSKKCLAEFLPGSGLVPYDKAMPDFTESIYTVDVGNDTSLESNCFRKDNPSVSTEITSIPYRICISHETKNIVYAEFYAQENGLPKPRWVFAKQFDGAPGNVFGESQNWPCGDPYCNQFADIFVVYDGSGSVASGSQADLDKACLLQPDQTCTGSMTEWNYCRYFVSKMISFFRYELYTGNTMGGCVFTSTLDYSKPLMFDKNTVFNSLVAFLRYRYPDVCKNYATCLACGMEWVFNYRNTYSGDTAQNHIKVQRNDQPVKARKIALILSDGLDNERYGDVAGLRTKLRDNNIIVFCSFIGDSTSGKNRLAYVASTYAGTLLSFPVNSFSTLSNNDFINSLRNTMCFQANGNPCGTSCNGWCLCETCVCPTSCESSTDLCIDGTCSPSSADKACVFEQKFCGDGQDCTFDECDSKKGCYNVKLPEDEFCAQVFAGIKIRDKCERWQCNNGNTDSPKSACSLKTLDCEDFDSCTTDVCTLQTINGKTDGFCDHPPANCNQCEHVTCDKSNLCAPQVCNDEGNCISKTKNCNDNNECTSDTCFEGTCYHIAISCDDGDPCTIDKCDAASGCFHELKDAEYCTDNNNCTKDFCDTQLGQCVNEPIPCKDASYCTIGICSAAYGCQYILRDCINETSKEAATLGNCYQAVCDEDAKRCKLKQLDGTVVDECGKCEGDGTSCKLPLSQVAATAVGGVAVASLVIAIVGIVAIIFLFAGKKGWDIVMKYRRNIGRNAAANPLYKDNMAGSNPLFQNKKI